MVTGWRGLTTAGLVLALVGACTSTPAGDPAAAGWTPVWSDDFDGAANSRLGTTDWSYALGTSYPGGAPQWGTGQIETATDSVRNVYLDGAGHLAIKPIRTGAGAGTWTSGRVETKRTDFAAPTGGKLRIEATVQQPAVGGAAAAGYWTAFWALGAPARPVGATNWPKIGEWDVMENVNGRESVWHTLHCGVAVGGPCAEPGGISSGELPCPGCRQGFHTYALEYDRSRTPEELRWYVDGRSTFTVKADRVDATTWADANQHGFFLILNVAIGGVFPANLGATPSPATTSGVPMLVDRVAVFSSEG
ncbi:MAG TPA: family 16 glycosylhydrolase [Actinoplanes sp.]